MDKKPESFEMTEYGEEHRHLDKTLSVITEIVRDQLHDSPAINVRVTFTGNLMKLTYHCYEMHLPVRMRDVEETARKALTETIKNIKKEYKSRTKETLELSERKEMENYSVQKVSLNERYMYASWRFFEIG